MSDRVSRRRFLAATVAAGAAADPALACFRRRLACPAPLPCPPVWPPPPGPDAGLRVRPNVAALTDAQLASLRRGVAAMKKLPAADRRSWAFQAAIHGTNDPTATNPLFNQCQHGTLQFLPWHRAYLYFFERILRWAAGDPALTLPYWDWTAQPVLPQPFRAPADAATNALFEPDRKANDASALPPQVVSADLDTALAQAVFPAAPGPGFSPDLENSPHGAVHVLVGGLGGLMSSVPTAAGDPIFWLHHCNVDRLWNVWLNRGGGRASPADPAFLDKPYAFADETGGTATVKVRDIIRSADLGYRYDGVPNPTVAFALTAQPVAGATAPPVAASSAPPDELALPLAKVEAKPLGFKEERVKLTTVKEHRATLATPLPARGPDAPNGPKVTVAVEGLAADAAPDFVYAVYVNLPAGEQPEEVRRRHYVGSINFFGKTRADAKGGHAHGAGDGFAATFDATAAVAGLQRARGFDPDALTVTLLPLAAAPPGVGAAEVKARGEAVAKKAQVTYKRVTVRVTPGEK